MIKLRFLMLLLLVSLILSSCSPSKSKIELTQDTALDMPIEETLDDIAEVVADGPPELPEVDEVPVAMTHKKISKATDFTRHEIQLEIFNSARSFTYEAYVIDQLNYVSIEDFCDIARKVNLVTNTTKTFRSKDFDLENLTLKLTYKAGRNPASETMDNFMNTHELNVNRIVIDGEDKEVMMDLSPFIKEINGTETVVIPIYLINSYIYNDACNLLRINDTQYMVTSSSLVDIYNYSLEYDFTAITYDDYETPLNHSLEMLKQFYSFVLPVTENSSQGYLEYVRALDKLMTNQEDTHYNLYFVATESELKLRDYTLDWRNDSDFWTYLSTENNLDYYVESPQWIGDNTFYFPLTSFGYDQDYINYFGWAWDDFTSKSTSNEKIFIVDLRNNHGGVYDYAFHMLEQMAKDTVELRMNNIYNQEVYSVNSYYFDHRNYFEEDYEIIVILNQSSYSASILFTGMLMDNLSVKVIGQEPTYKDSSHNVALQLLDGTIMTRSTTGYEMLNKDYVPYDDLTLVDEVMSDEEIEAYLESLSFE